MVAPKLTPMFEQYLNIKEQHPDALLFFRMGDFYELFFDDAELTARELQITLTARNPHSESPVPMCGVPHHAVDGYLKQLLEKGYRVAICDQIEDPKEAKGLVKRAVTRVLTPGTVVEENNLEAKGNNFLASLFWSDQNNAGGLAWVDNSTGEWSGLFSKRQAELWQWAQKISPRELLYPDGQKPPAGLWDSLGLMNHVPMRPYFEFASAKDKLLSAQGVTSLEVLDLADKKELTQACGALLTYLEQVQRQELKHLGLFRPLNLGRHLLLDEVTERNLEIFRCLDGRTGPGTLWHVMDRTLTPMGGRLLRDRLKNPWRELGRILQTQEMVALFFQDDQLRQDIRTHLDLVFDLERLSTRIFLGRATPKDFVALRQSLRKLPEIRSVLTGIAPSGEDETPLPEALTGVLGNWDDLTDAYELLDKALVDEPPLIITEGGLFRTGYDPDLDQLIELTEHGEGLLAELFSKELEKTGLNKLKLRNNKVFGYYFELPKTQAEKAPEYFIRRQTLVNCERFTTTELKELEEKLFSAVERRKKLEYELFQELRTHVAELRPRFLFMSGVVAGLDYWQALSEAARRWGWIRPEVHQERDIKIIAGRHPVVEAVQSGSNFIPNDITIEDGKNILLITGPNMAGKSTVLRQTAIITLMAQIGSFVPANQARIGLVDRIFSRVGASDNLAQGQSTFMVEMTETARILRQCGGRSLIILDEIGRGTSTFDGLALAWAVVEDLAKREGGKLRTLFATHYHELTGLEGKIPGVRNMNIAVKEWGGDIVFLRRLVPGPSDRSYGIEVAKLAGVPRPVVTRAKEILNELEKKAREANARIETEKAQMTLLPGFKQALCGADTPDEQKQEPHPLQDALQKINIDTLTPLEALNVLYEWKAKWGAPKD